jgi:hypothetical protein
MKYIAAALGAACLLAGGLPAAAKQADNDTAMVVQGQAKQRENIMLRVPVSVDLSDPLAVSELRAKAIRTIEQVCNPGDRLNADMAPDWQCRREMGANLEVALTQLAAPALARR